MKKINLFPIALTLLSLTWSLNTNAALSGTVMIRNWDTNGQSIFVVPWLQGSTLLTKCVTLTNPGIQEIHTRGYGEIKYTTNDICNENDLSLVVKIYLYKDPPPRKSAGVNNYLVNIKRARTSEIIPQGGDNQFAAQLNPKGTGGEIIITNIKK